MIKSKADFRRYLKADIDSATYESSVGQYIFNPTWRFMRSLRTAEYISNCKVGFFWSVLRKILIYRSRRLGNKLGYSIPINTCGEGLCLPHVGTIVINRKARLGKNCKIHVCVNVGADFIDSLKVPVIGDNCYIGPGVKIFGDVNIASGVVMGANAVVNRSVSAENSIVAGVPARVIGSVK